VNVHLVGRGAHEIELASVGVDERHDELGERALDGRRRRRRARRALVLVCVC
jgi:hypothetical protein